MPLALVLGVILFVPPGAGHALGVSLKSWLLFACAPVTSMLLAWLAARDGSDEQA